MRALCAFAAGCLFVFPAVALSHGGVRTADQNWAAYGGDPENTHYSPLQEINRGKVKNLRVAWQYDTGETGGLETSPLIVEGMLYGITPSQKIFALDAGTGKLLWKFDSGVPGTQPDRGLAHWSNPAGGGKDLNSPSGGVYVAFALPRPQSTDASEAEARLPPAGSIAAPNDPNGDFSGKARGRVTRAAPQKIIIDTDIGDDIDDAFAVALALRSPELQILGITTTFGDTATRAKLVDRLLAVAGREDIPVAAGTPTAPKTEFTQRAYAEGGSLPPKPHPAAVDFILDQIKRYPGQITLVEIGPLFNVGALIDTDLGTFRKLRRVVMMGGSIERGYGWLPYGPPVPPQPEWNIVNDIPAAQKLFAAGVPIYLMPLDSTQLKMDEVKRAFLFRQGKPLTNALTLLYHEWGQQTPTLFDAMTIAYILRPNLCPVQPMDIRVDQEGYTRRVKGRPDAEVCLSSDSEAFFDFYLRRLATLGGVKPRT
jgi:purine nucleosidase